MSANDQRSSEGAAIKARGQAAEPGLRGLPEQSGILRPEAAAAASLDKPLLLTENPESAQSFLNHFHIQNIHGFVKSWS